MSAENGNVIVASCAYAVYVTVSEVRFPACGDEQVEYGAAVNAGGYLSGDGEWFEVGCDGEAAVHSGEDALAAAGTRCGVRWP
jgi:hypothetical protein